MKHLPKETYFCFACGGWATKQCGVCKERMCAKDWRSKYHAIRNVKSDRKRIPCPGKLKTE